MELMEKLPQFIENWDFFSEAAITSTLAGALLGALGVYIILGRLVFLSAAMGQVSSAGVTLALWLLPLLGLAGHHDNMAAAGFSVIFSIAVLLLGAPFLKKSAAPHNILALLYLAGAAVTVLAGTKVVGQLQDVQGLLTGNAVLVEHSDYLLMIILTVFTLFFLIYSRRALVSAWFWPDTSQVRAIPVTFLRLLVYALLVVVIACTTRVMGALPVFALSCLPALAARRALTFQRMFFLALIMGAGCGFLGYLSAFIYEFPVGPVQTAVAVLLVLFAELMTKISKLVRRKNV